MSGGSAAARATPSSGGMASLPRSLGVRIPAPVLLLAPFFLLFTAFYVLPILWALRTSLYADRLIGGETFAGLDAYSRVLGDPSFWNGFRNVGVLSLVQIPLGLLLSLLFALVLDGRSLRAPAMFRLVIFLPYAVSTVIAGLMWGVMYDPDLGPLQQGASALGLPSPDLLSSDWMLPSIANILTWSGTGIGMIVLYTALKAIPGEIVEAAAVDGARPRDIVRDIKIPLVRPAIALLVLISVIGTLQLFNEPKVLYALAPQVIANDYTPNLYAYTLAFEVSDSNYAAALAFVLAAVVMVISYGALAIGELRRRRA